MSRNGQGLDKRPAVSVTAPSVLLGVQWIFLTFYIVMPHLRTVTTALMISVNPKNWATVGGLEIQAAPESNT
jgi:hypothetical protein